MKKSKILGILIIFSAVIFMVLVIGYTSLFSIFGISSGGSFLMIAPLVIIAIVLIIALLFLLRLGIKQLNK